MERLCGAAVLVLVLGGAGCLGAQRLIGSVEDLVNFAKLVEESSGVYTEDLNITVDLDLSTFVRTEPIGAASKTAWSGTLYGNHHIVSNFAMQGAGHAGLFYRVENAAVKQLVFDASCGVSGEHAAMVAIEADHTEFASVRCYGTVNGTASAGGIVAAATESNFSLCANEGTVSAGAVAGGLAATANGANVQSCTGNGTVTAHGEAPVAGGLFGRVEGNTVVLSNCVSAGTVSQTATAAEAAAAEAAVGGLIGVAASEQVTVNLCNNSGRVLAEGGVSGAGGLVGRLAVLVWGIVNRCYNHGGVEATAPASTPGASHRVGGLVGYSAPAADTTVNIRQCANFGAVTTSSTSSSSTAGGIAGGAGAETTIQDVFNLGAVTAEGAQASGIAPGGVVNNTGNSGSVSGDVAAGICYAPTEAKSVANTGAVTGKSAAFALWSKYDYQSKEDLLFSANDLCENNDTDVYKQDARYLTCSSNEDAAALLNARIKEQGYKNEWTGRLTFAELDPDAPASPSPSSSSSSSSSQTGDAPHACCATAAAVLALCSTLLVFRW